MRTLHLYAGNLYGGVERMLVTLARARGTCPGLACEFGLCFDGRLARELRAAGAAPHLLGPVRARRPWEIVRARRALRALLNGDRYDAVVCHAAWPHAMFAPVVRAAGLPLAYWAHDVPRGTHWSERWAARTPPDLAVANSRYTQSRLPALFPGVPTAACPCPVPAIPLDGPRRDVARADVRLGLGASRGQVVILMASRLEPWKGHLPLIAALGLLVDVPGWACWIAGGAQRPHEAAYLNELRIAATAAGVGARVRFLGERADVHRLMAAADVACQPNIGPEPFGIALVEAMAAGLPVVTSRLGGAAELVDERCGRLVRPGDVAGLAAALRGLIEDPVARGGLGAAGPARAAELCDPGVVLNRMHALLAGVIDRQCATV